MKQYYDADDHGWQNESGYENTEDEYGDSSYDSDTDQEDCHSQTGGYFGAGGTNGCNATPLVEWKLVKVGETVLHVSSSGKVRPYKSLYMSCDGYPVPGTPYRSYPIEHAGGEIKHIYMHNLVWYAFHGQVPAGWVVRHTIQHTRVPRRYYSNALANLTICDTETMPVSDIQN